jgi:K+-transporting ATPase ATPase C chain
LAESVKTRILALKEADPGNTLPIPVDLVTASGSGLDPHISPAAAEYQINRIAKARNLAIGKVQALVSQHTEQRQWWVLGEPRVSVLQLNLALDAMR